MNMIDKETYKKELIRMWDTLRDKHIGTDGCHGVKCEKCPLDDVKYGCSSALCALDIYNTVEKWSKANPPKKYQVSRMEYDMLQIYAINHISNNDTFNDFCTLRGLLDKGYFEGATGSMHIGEYYINCEVVDNDD